MPRSLPRAVLAAALLLTACAAPGAVDDATVLRNAGKEDGARVRLRLSEGSPAASLLVFCDTEQGCDGHVTVRVTSPDACSLLDDPRCGVARMDPASVPVADVVVRSATEGERRLPLRVHTGDGDFIEDSISASFYAASMEEVEIEVLRAEGAPDVTLDVAATWEDAVAPDVAALQDYLSSIPGLTWWEAATAYPGYRAYQLSLEQPLDHDDPGAGVFYQTAILHHLDRGAPTVLYTSGYDLPSEYLSELTEGFGANQLDVEQRFFGASYPTDHSPEDYDHVTIRQAAADQHRWVELLRPFYEGAWVGTGHSKGGMTSVYHRRFYPDDLDVTVAYVAPISFDTFDARYVPFLEAIGTDECRERVHGMQRGFLRRIDEIVPTLEAEATEAGLRYTFHGSFEAAFESAIESFEWSFWQAYGLESCGDILDESEVMAMGADELVAGAAQLFGYGFDDDALTHNDTYNYQAAAELGFPEQQTGHLADLERHPNDLHWVPAGTTPTHRPAAMEDIQAWVEGEGERLIFVYGEHDPWTGGAFAVPERDDVLRVTAPRATHAAMIRDLDADAQARVLDALEAWMGARPQIGPSLRPSRAPAPPGLRYEGFVR